MQPLSSTLHPADLVVAARQTSQLLTQAPITAAEKKATARVQSTFRQKYKHRAGEGSLADQFRHR